MKLKKFISTIITTTLMLYITIPTYASEIITQKSTVTEVTTKIANTQSPNQEKMNDAKISKDEAVELSKKAIKDYFNYVIDEQEFETRIEFRQDYRSSDNYIWQISLNKNSQNSSTNIDITIQSNSGKVNSANIHEYNHNQSGRTIAQITEDEAKVMAQSFLKKNFPDEYKDLKLNDNVYPTNNYNTSYHFNYSRYINNIKYTANTISITVDGIQGVVNGFYRNWDDDVAVPLLENVIDITAAEKVFEDNIEMNLNYIPYRSYDYNYSDKIKEAKLVYSPQFKNGYMVDAQEGIMISNTSDNKEEVVKDISSERKEEIAKQADKINHLTKEISEERAREIIGSIIKNMYGENYSIESLRYEENDNYYNTNGDKSWSAQFSNQKYRSYIDGGRIAINALTEQIISAQLYDHYESKVIEDDFNPTITWEQGYDKAIEAIETYLPDKIMHITTELKYVKNLHYVNNQLMPEYTYNYHFGRKVNDIPYRDDYISIEIDSTDGSIKQIRSRWNDTVMFPKSINSISKEDAQIIYFEKYKPELVYSRINKNNDYKNPDWEIKLVYILTNNVYTGNYIDAYTGKFLSYTGEEVTEVDKEFRELIKNHKAQKELSILASGGILDIKSFELDKDVKLMDAVKMLVIAKGYRPYMASKTDSIKYTNVKKDNDNYKYLQMAVAYGIIENSEKVFNFDKVINREELAEMIVRLLGYEDVARIDGIFKSKFVDSYKISKERLGYVAICTGLNIMETNDVNTFRPKQNVTMVDIAVAIYNALGQIRNN